MTGTAFELLDIVVVTYGYKKGQQGFVYTIKCNHGRCVYYVRFRDRKLIPFNEHELVLHRKNKVWVEPEKVVFT